MKKVRDDQKTDKNYYLKISKHDFDKISNKSLIIELLICLGLGLICTFLIKIWIHQSFSETFILTEIGSFIGYSIIVLLKK